MNAKMISEFDWRCKVAKMSDVQLSAEIELMREAIAFESSPYSYATACWRDMIADCRRELKARESQGVQLTIFSEVSDVPQEP